MLSITKYNRDQQRRSADCYHPQGMAARPVFHADLGRFFAELREARGFGSQRQAALVAKNRRLRVTYQVLQRLESGRTKNPEPELLRALSGLYDVDYEELVWRWVVCRFGVTNEIIRQAPSSERGSGVSSSADSLETRRVVDAERHEQLVAATKKVALGLLAMLEQYELRKKDSAAQDPSPRARRRSRRTG